MGAPFSISNDNELMIWRQIETQNPVTGMMNAGIRKLGYMLDDKNNQQNCVVLTGMAGVGKSNSIKRALNKRGVKAVRAKQNTYEDLLAAFEMAARKRVPLVIEEADEFLRSAKQLNVLKLATGPRDERRYPLMQKDDDGHFFERTINLDVKLILTSNADWTLPDSFTPAVRQHVKAISTRVTNVHFKATKEELWAYSCCLAINHELLLRPDGGRWFTVADQNKALDWFTRNLNRIDDASPRTLIKILRAVGQNPDDPALWEGDLSDIVAAPNAALHRPMVMPVIVPRKRLLVAA